MGQTRGGGLVRPPSWPAIAAVLVLHSVVLAALWMNHAPRSGADANEAVITVRLLDASRPTITANLEAKPREAKPLRPRQVSHAVARPAAPAIESKPPQDAPATAAISVPIAASAAVSHDEGLRRYAASIWKQIEAHKRGGVHRPGTALITFKLDGEGRLLSISITRSSGDAMLDAYALTTIRASAPFAPPPPDLGADELAFAIPFEFAQ